MCDVLSTCNNPEAGDCGFCSNKPCVLHSRQCGKCLEFYCSSQGSFCMVAHLCLPKMEPSFIERQLAR